MTNKQILKKAIAKAEWNIIDSYGSKVVVAQLAEEHPEIEEWKNSSSINDVIYSHSFAKAFWGKEWKDGDVIETPMSDILTRENIEPWQHHLKQMVLLPEDERLKYIEKFL